MPDNIPKREADLVNYTITIDNNVENVYKDLGLNPDGALKVKSTNAQMRTAIKKHGDAVNAEKTAKSEKDDAKVIGTTEIRSMHKEVKAAKGYTEAIGLKVGITNVGGSTFDPSVYKPKVTTKVMPGRVVIEFVKSELNGVNVYVRLKGETTWTKLAYDTYSPYEDNRPLAQAGVPEHREYMVIGVIHDVEVTLKSDIVEAVYAG